MKSTMLQFLQRCTWHPLQSMMTEGSSIIRADHLWQMHHMIGSLPPASAQSYIQLLSAYVQYARFFSNNCSTGDAKRMCTRGSSALTRSTQGPVFTKWKSLQGADMGSPEDKVIRSEPAASETHTPQRAPFDG